MIYDDTKNDIILGFLNKCNLKFTNFEQLDGYIIPREQLLSKELYNDILPEITKMKNIFSSSSLTALHKDAKDQQKWPLLNIVRQILKVIGFNLNPIRKSDGYDEQGKKKMKRFFKIQKMKTMKTI